MPNYDTSVPLPGYGAMPLTQRGYQPFWGTEGYPQLGGGWAGLAMNIAASVGAQGLMAPMGLTPMGITDRNLYDRWQQKRMTELHDQMIGGLAQQDRNSYLATRQGAWQLSSPGQSPTADMRKGWDAEADFAVKMAPMFAMVAPDFADALGGQRGLAAGFGQGAFQAAQRQIDSVTGRPMAADPARAVRVSSMVYDNLYGGENWKERSGMGATRMGQMYNELQARGLMGGPAQASDMASDPDLSRAIIRGMRHQGMELKGSLSELIGEEKLTGKQRNDLQNQLRGMDASQISALSQDASVSPALERFDAKKTTETLKKYNGAVAAMKDIFGEAGRTDVPMNELINSLNAMTGGALNQMDPSKVENSVRTMVNIAHNITGGPGLDPAMQAIQEATVMALQMGINPVFAPNAATQGLAMQQALTQSGAGGPQMWGQRDINETRQIEERRTLDAGNSAIANEMGMAMRLTKEMGMDAATMFKKGAAGDKARAWMEAVKEGRTTFANGKSVRMSEGEFLGMMSGGTGLSGESLALMLGEKATNKEYAVGAVSNLVRSLQPEELKEYAAGKVANIAGLSGGAAKAAVGALFNMSGEQRADAARRTQIMANAIEKQLMGTREGRVQLSGMSAAEKQLFLKTRASIVVGELAEDKVFDEKTGSLATALASDDQATQAAKAAAIASGQTRTEAQKAAAPEGRGDAVRRLIQSLQDVKPDDDKGILKVFAEFAGGIGASKAKDAIDGPEGGGDAAVRPVTFKITNLTLHGTGTGAEGTGNAEPPANHKGA